MEILVFNVKSMRVLFVWPFSEKDVTSGRYRRNFICFIIMPSILLLICVSYDFYRQVGLGMRDDIVDVTENILVICCVLTMMYTCVCYQLQISGFLDLRKELMEFNQFGVPPDQVEAEKTAHFVSAGFYIYAIAGSIVYFFLPFLSLAECEERRAKSVYSQHIPCGMFSRLWLPFRFDHSPMFEVAETILIVPLSLFALICITTYTLLYSYVVHLVSHISNFKRKLPVAVSSKNAHDAVGECVRYHIEIIRIYSKLNVCFNRMAFIHITVTSISLSVLGYGLVQFVSAFETFRVLLHFAGWLAILFIACYSGQKLVDESESIYQAAYDTNWPDADVRIQKTILLIILRSQKPLTLSTGGFGTLSLEMFLSITSTAYTYFTLLVSQ